MAMVGAPMIMPMAKAVISRPAWETLTPRSPANSGSRPATTNSVVPIRNVPAASTQTTKGSLPGVVPDAEGIRGISPCVENEVIMVAGEAVAANRGRHGHVFDGSMQRTGRKGEDLLPP